MRGFRVHGGHGAALSSGLRRRCKSAPRGDAQIQRDFPAFRGSQVAGTKVLATLVFGTSLRSWRDLAKPGG